VIIHALIFLALLFTVMKTSIPPFPETGGSGGVIVNIGYLDEAGGLIQPVSENITVDPSVTRVQEQSQPEENFITQDLEESPIAKENKEVKKNEVKPVNTQVNTAKEVKKVTTPVKTVDPKSIYTGKSNTSKSQGTGVGEGDQGDPLGDPNSKYTGNNGSGTGVGQGDGEGTGSGSGKGVSFSLSGRRMLRTPQINDRSQETGKVVVDITVDKDGVVVAAIPGGRGSTTTSAYLFKLAKDAAMKAKFNPSPDGADIQKGTISFVFLVQ
jgi:outer membrane biosynthesis protein TonB